MQVKKNENLKRNIEFDVPTRLTRIWPYLLLTYADASVKWEYLLNVSTSKIEYSERYD